MRRDLLILLGLVLLIRLPFIAQPIQGDDVFYLIFANNALADPLHPLQTSFRLQGEVVWGAGHTRPPGVAWIRDRAHDGRDHRQAGLFAGGRGERN